MTTSAASGSHGSHSSVLKRFSHNSQTTTAEPGTAHATSPLVRNPSPAETPQRTSQTVRSKFRLSVSTAIRHEMIVAVVKRHNMLSNTAVMPKATARPLARYNSAASAASSESRFSLLTHSATSSAVAPAASAIGNLSAKRLYPKHLNEAATSQ